MLAGGVSGLVAHARRCAAGTPPHEFTLDEPLLPLEPPVGEFGWLCFASPRFAELNAHPVQLWLLEQFMGCSALCAHPPVARINMPEEYWTEVEGARGGEGGWHLDTPYAWQELKDHVATNSGVFPVERPLGVRECASRGSAPAAPLRLSPWLLGCVGQSATSAWTSIERTTAAPSSSPARAPSAATRTTPRLTSTPSRSRQRTCRRRRSICSRRAAAWCCITRRRGTG